MIVAGQFVAAHGTTGQQRTSGATQSRILSRVDRPPLTAVRPALQSMRRFPVTPTNIQIVLPVCRRPLTGNRASGGRPCAKGPSSMTAKPQRPVSRKKAFGWVYDKLEPPSEVASRESEVT